MQERSEDSRRERKLFTPRSYTSFTLALLNNIVAFGATDRPLTNTQIAKSTHGSILHIPITLGATAIAYNLSSIPLGSVRRNQAL